MKHYKSAESVTKGHPDKLCDYIADSILDGYLKGDESSRVAVEVMATKGLILVAGEVTSKAALNVENIVRDVLFDVDYEPQNFEIEVRLHAQSPDIAQGVDRAENLLGAGDQGIVYGYATDETPEYLPLPQVLARRLTMRLEEVREKNIIPELKPDGKCLVTVEYENGEATRIHSVVLSSQHKESISNADLRKAIHTHVIRPALEGVLPFEEEDIHINPTGRFVIGGPEADTGLTGRKLAVDTYGGLARHGGGAFSGKDPTKVDRSGAYMARLIARSVVSSGLAKECEVSIAYAIGRPEPLYFDIDCFGTETKDIETIKEECETLFPLSVLPMIHYLKLRQDSYAPLAIKGHFGDSELPWENDLAGLLFHAGVSL
jgi:S-adenosylmethionine synthetase